MQFVDFLRIQGAPQDTLLKSNKKVHGLVADYSHCGQIIKLLLPQTYMNQSGLSIVAAMRCFNLNPDQILLVHDELDLAPGTARIKYDGGHGGHNGLRDIFQASGRRDFYRLRIGIGHPGDKSKVLNFVLKPAGTMEQQWIHEAMYKASQAPLDALIQGKYAQAMQILHQQSTNHSKTQ